MGPHSIGLVSLKSRETPRDPWEEMPCERKGGDWGTLLQAEGHQRSSMILREPGQGLQQAAHGLRRTRVSDRWPPGL